VPVTSTQIGVICDSMAHALPKEVDGQKRRDTTPSSTRTAAWGDPPVVLRCGVARPKALKRTSQLNTVNGVDWLVEDRDGGHVFTSVNRAVYVEITVPAGHDPQVGPLVDVAPAMQYVPVRPEFDQPEVSVKKPRTSPKPKP
jgi:hypothetical protein